MLIVVGTEGKKRKRGKASAYDIITYVAKSLNTCSKVLDTVEGTFKGTNTMIFSEVTAISLLLFVCLSVCAYCNC